MRRALEIALNGQGYTSPNPMVGCVIVANGKVIGEGWHRQYGGPHAEVNAVNAVEDHTILPSSTVYVTLEPCSHYGKTPPCADMLISKKVGRVVVGCLDPNPLVAGRGIQKLQKAGISTTTGILESETQQLNKRFFTFQTKKRPYIVLKWAETADGFIARENFDSKWISNTYSRKLVHRMRAIEDAVLVGTNTARHDDPTLNVRDWEGKDPLRLVVDNQLLLPQSLKLFDGTLPTICYNLLKDESIPNIDYVKLDRASFLDGLLDDLYNRKILSAMVEGGTKLISSFLDSGLWDEAWVFKSPTTFGSGISAPKPQGLLSHTELIMDDKLFVYQNNKNT